MRNTHDCLLECKASEQQERRGREEGYVCDPYKNLRFLGREQKRKGQNRELEPRGAPGSNGSHARAPRSPQLDLDLTLLSHLQSLVNSKPPEI